MPNRRPKESPLPVDAAARRAIAPVVCYPVATLPGLPDAVIAGARSGLILRDSVTIPPRQARCFRARAGQVIRIRSVEGPQVGDLNLWHAHDLSERFFSGKTRALHGTHVTTGDRLWSSLPHLRPMASVVADSLDWYGIDDFGGAVHDVIGTHCLLSDGGQYHHCCHSNLTRALAAETGLSLSDAERHIHDVLNVFMCTGFTRDTGQYFMKASPVRPGDHLDILAEIDLVGALSACPGGDCGSEHSSDSAPCFPLLVEVFDCDLTRSWAPAPINGYDRSHGA